jgi:uncharacterized protein YjfI (DUF2170 family)
VTLLDLYNYSDVSEECTTTSSKMVINFYWTALSHINHFSAMFSEFLVVLQKNLFLSMRKNSEEMTYEATVGKYLAIT